MPKLSTVLYRCGQTINLAKGSSYQVPRKPPLNTLVFEKLPDPKCAEKVTCGIKGPPVTKPVRVCSKEELQAMYCPPVPCDCKAKPPPLTFSQKIGLLVKECLKALAVGGFAYYTYKEGLWGSAFHSSCFLGKYVTRCPPEDDDSNINEFADISTPVIDDPEPCYPFIPHSGYALYKLGHLWNQIVIYAFWFILDAPGEMFEALMLLLYPPPPPKEVPVCPK